MTNEREFRAAAEASDRGDVTILIDREIEITRMITFPKSKSIVRIIGVSNQAALFLNMRFAGNVQNIESAITNGLAFNCRQAVVANIAIHGFDMQGSAIKGDTEESLSVINCYFHDIGTKEYPFRGGKARTAADSIYSQCIGAHELWNCQISVIGCRFERCTSNTGRWSHCLYLSANAILISDNDFIECGNPFELGHKDKSSNVQIISNRVSRPRPGRDPSGAVIAPYLSLAGRNDSLLFTRNKISGRFNSGWTGEPNPRRSTIDYNDYSEMEYDGASWAANVGVGQYITWDQWLQMGFDTHSKPPVRRQPTPAKPGRPR